MPEAEEKTNALLDKRFLAIAMIILTTILGFGVKTFNDKLEKIDGNQQIMMLENAKNNTVINFLLNESKEGKEERRINSQKIAELEKEVIRLKK